MENNWQAKAKADVLKLLQSSEDGLSLKEAADRLKKYGANKLPEDKPDNPVLIFLRQFQSPLIYVLLIAAAIIFFIGEPSDSLIILAILLFNAAVGTIQEGKAQNTLLALKNFVQTKATVMRAGRELIISDAEVVPGDIIILQEGEKVPADARVILSYSLNLDEAMLTGESEPEHKIVEPMVSGAWPAAEIKNMVFKGSYVLSGNGRAVVVATGLETVIGKIAKKLEIIDTEIPSKANIRELTRLIIAAVAGISLFLFLFGMVTGKSAVAMLATVVALAVSIIPEGLPIVITLVLATGVWRLSKQNVLVKKLPAVEALGQARVIAIDKTGTITKNEMVAQEIYAGDKRFSVSGFGYESKGEIKLSGEAVSPPNHPELLLVGKIACFCANARVMYNENTGQWQVAGDPTEAALKILAQKIGFIKDELEREAPLVIDFPFDYKLKYHAAVHQSGGRKFLAVAGAPEVILKLCQKIRRHDKSFSLEEESRKNLESVFLEMSRNGMRVVALAETGDAKNIASARAVGELTFVALIGMKDALRPEAAAAVEKNSAAGLRLVMITGDHKNTAQTIAQEAGIYRAGDLILTGAEIDELSDKNLQAKIADTTVFARVTPDHKLRIIQAYKARGEIVAMTGDGVNDAPSLVAADLGIAMGGIGTEVAKEASDLVLLDDNLANVASAVAEGRHIYRTVKKVVLYFFSTNAGEVLVIAGALALSLPLPLLPAQIIWLNFVTDGFLDMALAMEPKEKNLLTKKLKRPNRLIVDSLMARRMLLMALPMAAGVLYLFNNYLASAPAKAWTISLTVLAVCQWFNAWNCRFEEKSIFQTNFFANKFLVGATLIVIALQLLAVYQPLLQKILHTVPLGPADWLVVIPIAASIIIVEEVRKFFYRRKLNLII